MLSPGETGTVKAWTDMESIKIKVIEVPIIVRGELKTLPNAITSPLMRFQTSIQSILLKYFTIITCPTI
jgi:hypothetical protein